MALNTYPYNPFPASTDKLDEAHNADLQQEVDQLKSDTEDLQEDVENLETDKTDTTVIAPTFDAEAGTYDAGDLVTYEGKLYEFTSAHSAAGAWDPTEVTEKTVADEIGTEKSGLNNVIALGAFCYATKTIDLPSEGIDTVQFTTSDFTIPSGYIANPACVIVSAIGNWGKYPEMVGLSFNEGNSDMSGGLNVNIKASTAGGFVTYRVNVLLGIYKS